MQLVSLALTIFWNPGLVVPAVTKENVGLWNAQGGLAPLTLTLGSVMSEKPSDPKECYIRHSACTAEGMSGGPIVRFDVDSKKIQIIGVVGVSDILMSEYIMFTFPEKFVNK